VDRLLTRAAQKHACVNRAATVRERWHRPWLRKAVGRKVLIPAATIRERNR
jgi:hypothetical protein